jgi:hypothetical protein
MPGVPRELAEHRLEVSKTARPIKQKLWRFAKDRKQAIEVELCKLLVAGFIRVSTPGLARKPGSCTKENWWIKDMYRLQ